MLSDDTLYNLQEIADDTKFIKEIASYPDVIVFTFHDKIREFLLGLLNRKDLPFMALTVDTTFEMTDGYVTVLVACFTEFVNCPAISVATMIYERKLGSTHRFFWEKVRQHFPEMCTANNVYVVSDEEKAIVDVMKEYIPNLRTFRCWNHIFTNAKLKLKA